MNQNQVTASSALTVIMYVPSSEARKTSPSSSVELIAGEVMWKMIIGLVQKKTFTIPSLSAKFV